jgi:hypothetical protein
MKVFSYWILKFLCVFCVFVVDGGEIFPHKVTQRKFSFNNGIFSRTPHQRIKLSEDIRLGTSTTIIHPRRLILLMIMTIRRRKLKLCLHHKRRNKTMKILKSFTPTPKTSTRRCSTNREWKIDTMMTLSSKYVSPRTLNGLKLNELMNI